MAPTPSPPSDPDVDEADMEEEDDEVMEEEEEDDEEEEEEEVGDMDEEEVVDVDEEEEEEEVVAVKDPEEYEDPMDQTPEYLDSFDYEKGHKPTDSTPLLRGEGCKGHTGRCLCCKLWTCCVTKL